MDPVKTPIDLSVVIVNYNVEYFLEQCLNSVKKASPQCQTEVFVVDNNSSDRSVEMVKDKFPDVHLIANKDNKGFSMANNQAIKISKGKYILLLNPDTVVEEHTFEKIIQFMNETPICGGLGVRMVDGNGDFLPESKRGLPTPAVAFYKIFGLSALFPKSKRFGAYHLGYFSENEIHEIDILSGAFLCVSREAVDQIGLLDETFFMYGEDIDFSYRITKAGFKNYYFPKTTIIHYKGESTKKSSVNYVFVFYKAMVIFAQKHFSKNNAKTFSFAIHAAIYFRALLAIANRFIKFSFPFIADFGIILLGLFLLTNHWKASDIHFPDFVFRYSIPIYGFTWLMSSLFFGVYDKEPKPTSILKSTLFGTALILLVYALLPKDAQFSRVFILLGGAWVIFAHYIKTSLTNLYLNDTLKYQNVKTKHFIICGDAQETDRVKGLLEETYLSIGSMISFNEETNLSHEINKYIHKNSNVKFNELIFCAKNVTPSEIISCMNQLAGQELHFKIAQPDTSFIIGSNSIETRGDLYAMKINSILRPYNLRSKRLFDLFATMIGFSLSPLLIWFYKDKKKVLMNLFSVLKGSVSFVGYCSISQEHIENKNTLPSLKKGLLNPLTGNTIKDHKIVDQVNINYAKDYSIIKDLRVLINKWTYLDL
ncbi:MAG: glycosyltransferase family 2 protein [Crocinitomicaceae bacterium]